MNKLKYTFVLLQRKYYENDLILFAGTENECFEYTFETLNNKQKEIFGINGAMDVQKYMKCDDTSYIFPYYLKITNCKGEQK